MSTGGVICVEICVKEDSRVVEIWLTSGEKSDPRLRAGLQSIYGDWKAKKYLVAVYASGSRDLFGSTAALLAYNKKRVAELAVQQEKQFACPTGQTRGKALPNDGGCDGLAHGVQ